MRVLGHQNLAGGGASKEGCPMRTRLQKEETPSKEAGPVGMVVSSAQMCLHCPLAFGGTNCMPPETALSICLFCELGGGRVVTLFGCLPSYRPYLVCTGAVRSPRRTAGRCGGAISPAVV